MRWWPPWANICRPAAVWVDLPEGVPSRALLPQAEAAGVSFIPGANFHLDGGGQTSLRLALSLYPPETLAEAARRLGAAASRPGSLQ